jgi:hypothetical protein
MISFVRSTAAPKLEACQPIGRDEVAGDTDHEQVAGTLVERQFWRNPGIRAAEDRGERRLALCAAGACCGEVALARLVRGIARIAFDQQVQRRIRCVGGCHGLGLRHPGERRGSQQPGGRKQYSAAAQPCINTGVAHASSPPTLARTGMRG